jgi:hypothetical protein
MRIEELYFHAKHIIQKANIRHEANVRFIFAYISPSMSEMPYPSGSDPPFLRPHPSQTPSSVKEDIFGVVPRVFLLFKLPPPPSPISLHVHKIVQTRLREEELRAR